MFVAPTRALDPTYGQRTYGAQACGTARCAYHGAVAAWQRQDQEGGTPLEAVLRQQLHEIKALRANLARLKRLSRSVSRKVHGSANWCNAKAKMARLHARISNIRADAVHTLTTELVGRCTVIGIEDLNVRGMMAHDRLARSRADMGLHAFRRQLDYQAALYGSRVVVADRWYPSSKTCGDCGRVIAALPLSVRAWQCPDCGAHHEGTSTLQET